MSGRDALTEREWYRAVVADVRERIPGVKVSECWVYKESGGQWEFHYSGFYWHGRAAGAFGAKAKGWEAYLKKMGLDEEGAA